MARDMELRIRLSKEELKAMREVAKAEYMELSTWARVMLMKAVENRELPKPPT